MNVLVYAHRQDASRHDEYRDWVNELIGSDSAFGVSDLVLSGFIRVVTHPRIFATPTPLPLALEFVTALREEPNAVSIAPGPRHWDIFVRLCRAAGVKGNLVPDAFNAALAIEAGAEWITSDADYSRFPGLRWWHPLGVV